MKGNSSTQLRDEIDETKDKIPKPYMTLGLPHKLDQKLPRNNSISAWFNWALEDFYEDGWSYALQ